MNNKELFGLIKDIFDIEVRDENDIQGAWLVVEKFQKEEYLYPQLIWSHSWVFKIWRNNPNVDNDYGWIAEEYADTAPLAICRVGKQWRRSDGVPLLLASQDTTA